MSGGYNYDSSGLEPVVGGVGESPLPEVLPAQAEGQKELAPYLTLLGQIYTTNAINAPLMLTEFLRARELTSRFYSKAIQEGDRARTERKRQWAIAKLERSSGYLNAKGIKFTEAASGAYADMDPFYLQSAEVEAYWKQREAYFQSLLFSFISAHDDVRKIYEMTRDPKGSVSSMPSGPANWTGGVER